MNFVFYLNYVIVVQKVFYFILFIQHHIFIIQIEMFMLNLCIAVLHFAQFDCTFFDLFLLQNLKDQRKLLILNH